MVNITLYAFVMNDKMAIGKGTQRQNPGAAGRNPRILGIDIFTGHMAHSISPKTRDYLGR